MEKILGILKDAEGVHLAKKKVPFKTEYYQPFDEKDILTDEEPELRRYSNKFSTTLGQELFTYNVIKTLNDKQIIMRNPSLWENDPQTCIPVYNTYIEKFKDKFNSVSDSLFNLPDITINGKLNSYQAMSRYFINNKSKCHNMIKKDLRNLSKTIVTHKYSNFANHISLELPQMKVPNPYPYGTDSPLILRSAVPTEKNELNLLPFLLPDHLVLERFFSKQQVNADLIQSLMVSQQMEGFYIFRILVKKNLQILSEMENRELIRNFIQKDTSDPNYSDLEVIKAVIASMSKLPTRLSYSASYQQALKYNDIDLSNKKYLTTLMAEYFDRFIGVLYRIKPKEVDAWVTKFIAYYIENANSGSIQEKLAQSLDDFKMTIEAANINAYASSWDYQDRKHHELKLKKMNKSLQ